MDIRQEQTVSLLTGMRTDGWTYKSLAEREAAQSAAESGGQGHEQREQLKDFRWRIRRAQRHWRNRQYQISGGDALRGDTRSHPEHVS